MSIGASPGYGVGSHSQTHPSSHGSSTTSYPSQTQAQPQIPTTLVAAYAHDERRRSAVPQNLYFYTLACSPLEERDVCLPVDGQEGQGEEGQRSQQEGSVNVMEGQRNSKTRLRYHQPSSAQGRHGVGYGDEYPSAASAFTAASRGVSYGDGNGAKGVGRAGYRYPQAVQSASTSPNDLDVRRLGRRLGQQQQCSPHKGFTQQQHYSPRYHGSASSQQASPQYQPPPQHHTQQRAQQGTCSQHSSPMYRPLNSTQGQQQQQRGYHQASPHLSRGTSPQYHQHQPQPQQQQRHSRQMQQSQGLPRFHDNVWNTQPAVVAPPPPHSHSLLPEEEEVQEVLTARPPEVVTARQEVFVGIAAPKPKYALPVVQLREGDGEVEMGYVDEDEDEDDMGEEDDVFEEEEEEEDEGMEEEEEREWAQVEQHPQQQHWRGQQYHEATTYGSNGNEAAYRSKETTYHSNEINYRDESAYRPNETTTAYANKTVYRPETATAATFANAGPPGVCFYPTPSLSVPYASRHQYSSSRRW